MNRSVVMAGLTKWKDGRAESEAMGADEFLTQAACAALTGLLANPIAHEERIPWDDLSIEAWNIAEQMLKCAPEGLLAPRASTPGPTKQEGVEATKAA